MHTGLSWNEYIVFSKENTSSGITRIITDGETAVDAYSNTDEKSVVSFNQSAMINAYKKNGANYVTEYHNKPYSGDALAIWADRNSQINLNKQENSYAIYGDICALEKVADKNTIEVINVGGKGSIIIGDVIAGNTGKINIDMVSGNIEGRIDDYGDAGKDNVFDPKEFGNCNVTESGNIDVKLKDSIWTARHQSWVTSLGLDNSLIDLTKDEASSVVIGKLSGNGMFNMHLNSKDHSKGNMLYIGEGSGKHTVNIVGGITGGYENISEDNPLRFATVKNSGGTFDVAEPKVKAYTKSAGIYDLEYFVKKEDFNKNDSKNEEYNGGSDGSINGEKGFKPGNYFVENVLDANDTAENWIITGVKAHLKSDAGKTIINMSRVNYANAIYMDRLNKRMGEVRYFNDAEDEGMWVRLRHDRIGKDNAFRVQNTMYEVGYDQKQECDNGVRRVGFAADYMHGDAEYKGIGGDGEVKRYGLWLYDTWHGEKGHYADYVAKWGHLKNDFDITALSSGEEISGDYSNNVLSISAEYGRKKDLGKRWYWEPQAQLQFAHVTDADYVTSQGSNVSLDSINSLIGRAGFRIGKDLDQNTSLYFKADVLHEFLGDQDIIATDKTGVMKECYDNEGTWYDLGVGFVTKMNDDSYAYLDVEKSFGNDNDETWQVNVGLQWSF